MDDKSELIEMTAEIVSAYVGANTVSASDLPSLIQSVHKALSGVSTGVETVEVAPKEPAVSIKKSITPDFLICLEDGRKFKSLKRHLPTISLIDVTGEPLDYRLRLAGTGLYNVYGREITGRTLDDVYNTSAAEYWRAELDKVVEQRRPGVGVHNFGWRGASHLSILWLRLPLASDGVNVDMILGYDALLGVRAEGGSSGIRAA